MGIVGVDLVRRRVKRLSHSGCVESDGSRYIPPTLRQLSPVALPPGPVPAHGLHLDIGTGLQRRLQMSAVWYTRQLAKQLVAAGQQLEHHSVQRPDTLQE